jgi:Fuc2NAc and GlcNAc transferase
VTALQIAFVVAIAVLVALGTGVVRRLALKRSWLDIPNERSSHTVPTPRGGGVAIALALLGGLSIATALGWVSRPFGIGVVVGGSLVAAIGWIDDRRSVGVVKRIIVHLAAAIVGVMLLGGVPSVRFGAEVIHLGPAGSVLAVLFVAWCVNLYNFMDGIDGIAGTEALFVGIVAGAFSLSAGSVGSGASGIALVAFIVAAAALGFLLWNWAPARIFMGDAGSGLLGYVYGILAIASERSGSLPISLWFLLLGVFIFDATVTLVRRLLNRETWYSAHRSHAYQRLVISGWSHQRVVCGVVAVNVVLATLVLLAWRRPALFLPCVVAGVFLLSVIYMLIDRRRPMYAEANR